MNTISRPEPATQTIIQTITREDVLDKTHYGLNVYSHILRQFYPGATVLYLSGTECKPARNPFSNGSESLSIYLEEGVFIFEDTLDSDFWGSPFDFAERFYNIKGIDLLIKLNEDLHLNIGNHFHFTKTDKSFTDPIINIETVKITIPKFSFFKSPVANINPSKEISLIEVYDLIRNNTYQDITEKLRSHSDPAKARDFKANRFDYVTFSGSFSKRNDKSLLKHSGLITIDFDHIADIPLLKQQLLNDEYFDTELMFVSPSGTGLKWIISIDLTEGTHLDYFKSIAAYILTTYNLEIDKSGKDISRACFLCYDPDAYINPKYLEL
jgi:hypothetical protein